MTNRSWLSGLLTSICHWSLVISHLSFDGNILGASSLECASCRTPKNTVDHSFGCGWAALCSSVVSFSNSLRDVRRIVCLPPLLFSWVSSGTFQWDHDVPSDRQSVRRADGGGGSCHPDECL